MVNSTICLSLANMYTVVQGQERTHTQTSSFHLKLMPRTWKLPDDHVLFPQYIHSTSLQFSGLQSLVHGLLEASVRWLE